MKKTLAALAVLGAFAGSSMAADVTLYGDVDLGLKYTHEKVRTFTETQEGTDTFEQTSGVNSASKFGLKGTEDLGNGLKVGFKLENGFDADSGTLGQDGRLFGREAALTLYTPAGSLAFGRMGGVGSAAGTYDLVYGIGESFDGGDEFAFGFAASGRYDNMITYQTPQFAGLQLTAQYSFKNDNKVEKVESVAAVEGRSTADRYASVALTGEYGPSQFVAAYELTKYSTANRLKNKDADDAQVFYLGGNYDFGVAKVFALGQYFTGVRSFAGYDTKDYDMFGLAFDDNDKGYEGYSLHLGTIVPVAGGELTVGAYYSDAKAKDLAVSNNKYDRDVDYYGLAARYCYPLSERTTVYVGAGYAEGTADKIANEAQDAKVKAGGAYLGLSHHF